VPPFFPTGQPIVRFNSVVSTSAQKDWVVLTAGYEFFNPALGRSLLQPRFTLLAALDPVDGSVISTTPLRDTNEGVVTFGSDGSIYTDHSAILSSVFFYGINPLLQGAGLPAPYLAPGPPPGGRRKPAAAGSRTRGPHRNASRPHTASGDARVRRRRGGLG
jgi:hypothetical protein